MKVALDTNVLVYAEGFGDAARCNRARDLLDALPLHNVVIPAQCMGELFRVLHGKAGLARQEAVERVLAWAELYNVADSSAQAFLVALDLARSHAVQIWDALIVAVASSAQCRSLVTEDVAGESFLAGVKIVSPFDDAGYQDVLVTGERT
ncbi:MAG TPA: PIN domain-containing protein [Gammaproteobacteria bacterium]|nr:PIN domain-containing protein [Gammaproteobacteria bacterium]